jgi:hypothetical protein
LSVVVSGVAALLVLTMSTDPSAFLTSQVQPEPKLPTADLVKASLKASKEPHLASMAAASAPRGWPPPAGLQAVPVEGVVPDLRRVVEHAARRLADDVLEGQVLELGALDQVVQVGDVGLMVLAMVELERLLGDDAEPGRRSRTAAREGRVP